VLRISEKLVRTCRLPWESPNTICPRPQVKHVIPQFGRLSREWNESVLSGSLSSSLSKNLKIRHDILIPRHTTTALR
jgi:hypothetical protein